MVGTCVVRGFYGLNWLMDEEIDIFVHLIVVNADLDGRYGFPCLIPIFLWIESLQNLI
jgi:hypothetical protein